MNEPVENGCLTHSHNDIDHEIAHNHAHDICCINSECKGMNRLGSKVVRRRRMCDVECSPAILVLHAAINTMILQQKLAGTALPVASCQVECSVPAIIPAVGVHCRAGQQQGQGAETTCYACGSRILQWTCCSPLLHHHIM